MHKAGWPLLSVRRRQLESLSQQGRLDRLFAEILKLGGDNERQRYCFSCRGDHYGRCTCGGRPLSFRTAEALRIERRKNVLKRKLQKLVFEI